MAPFVTRWFELPYRDLVDPQFRAIEVASSGGDHLAAVRRFGRPNAAHWDPARIADAVFAVFADVPFDAVFVMRSYLAELARRYFSLPQRPLIVLDADDDDVAAHERFARLRQQVGDPYGAALDRVDARHYAAWEADWLPRFDTVFAASPVDAARLAGRVPAARLAVLPNVVRTPPDVPSGPVVRDIPLLMVGNFGYLPNAEAAVFLCREVLPRLQDNDVAARIALVGSSPLPAVTALARLPDVELIVGPPDIADFYRRATIAVAPIHAGGGTRIKLLEAFAFGVPVVATTLAAEGLAVTHARELFLADDASSFATACATLLEQPSLRRLIALQARQLHAARYSMAALRATLAPLADAAARR